MKTTCTAAGVISLVAALSGCGEGLSAGDEDFDTTAIDETGSVEQGEEATACTSSYKPYSGVSTITGHSVNYKWTQGFEPYDHNTLLECSSDKSRRSWADVTSGCLYAKHTSNGKFGWTTTHNFRAVARKFVSGSLVRWRNTTVDASFHVKAIQSSSGKKGVNLFARYVNGDNLYVAAFKTDGTIFIQSKVNCKYRTIVSGTHSFSLNTWYDLGFTVFRQSDGRDQVKLFINGTRVLNGYSNTTEANHLKSGLMGVRTDYVNTYIENWKAK